MAELGLPGGRETFQAQRTQRFGDPDDPDAVSGPMPASTSLNAAAIARQAGLAVRSADEIRSQARAQRDYTADRLNPRYTDPRAAETTRDRAARLHRPVTPVRLDQPGDEPWNGSLPVYRAGLA